MDIQRLQTAVFDKTGIRLDRTDPVFALVALNEIVVADLLAGAQEQWAHNNADLDAKIGALVKINEQILAGSKDLAARVDQAQLAAAMKAVAEAKAEIFKAARDAVTVEVSKASGIISEGAAQLAAERKKARSSSWGLAIVQAIISGIVGALVVLAAMYLR
ncbi:hypothetical protein [Massilia putida]|uniref:hypothetical protein n=1 Tax=Massilia putida TaxID=1141883 RepID=UPI000952F450|nr:hypothetical protein [Massilia putida]